jgi:hypothetical protein
MDPSLVAILVGVAGIGGTVLGVVVADTLSARRDKAARLLDRRLAALQQTKQLIHAHLTDALQVAAGGSSTRVYGADVYPLSNPLLVGDVEALRRYLQVAIDLLRRPKGQPARESDAWAMTSALTAVDAAIARQEALVLEDKPFTRLPPDQLSELAPLFEQMGHPVRAHRPA